MESALRELLCRSSPFLPGPHKRKKLPVLQYELEFLHSGRLVRTGCAELQQVSSLTTCGDISSVCTTSETGSTERFGVSEPAGQPVPDTRSMPHDVSKSVEPHLVDRQPLRINEPEADFQITFVDGAEGEALAQQQANVFLEIARWQAARQDGGTTRL